MSSWEKLTISHASQYLAIPLDDQGLLPPFIAIETSLSHRSQDTSPTRYRSSTEVLIAFTLCLCSRLPIVSVCEAKQNPPQRHRHRPSQSAEFYDISGWPVEMLKAFGATPAKGRRDLGKRPPRCRHSRKENNVSENKYYCSIDPEY